GRAIPPPGTEKAEPLTVAEIAAKMTHTGGPIVGRASLYAPMAGPAFGAHICDLEVDPETGQSRVVRYTAFQDVGKAVHPSFTELPLSPPRVLAAIESAAPVPVDA